MKTKCILLTIFLSKLCFAQDKTMMDFNQAKHMLLIVENLMGIAEFAIRDTWKGVDGYNYDDYFGNNSYNGPKQLKVILKEDGVTDTEGKTYVISGFKSLAYDSYKIRIPRRLIGIQHNIIHEIVHFLQENHAQDESNYILFKGNNYKEYVSQRTEFEAHYIQLLYIEKYELEKLKLENNILIQFQEKNKESLKNKASRLDLIFFAKTFGII